MFFLCSQSQKETIAEKNSGDLPSFRIKLRKFLRSFIKMIPCFTRLQGASKTNVVVNADHVTTKMFCTKKQTFIDKQTGM
jgi:hypothetical protein